MMKTLVAFLALGFLSSGVVAQQSEQQQIDGLFEKFSSASPGCAVGVEKDGATLFSKGYGMEFAVQDGRIFALRRGELVPIEPDEFVLKNTPEFGRLLFDHASPPQSFELIRKGESPLRFERAEPVLLSNDAKNAYTGDYESRELNATYHVVSNPSGLAVVFSDLPPANLRGVGPDRMLVGGMNGQMVFSRDQMGKVSGFSLSAGRVRNLEFRRVD